MQPTTTTPTLCIRDRSTLAHLRPRTPAQLRSWLSLALDLEIPRAPRTPGADSPFDYLVHAFLGPQHKNASPDCIVWACRGGGKTFYAAVATLLDLLFHPGIDVRLLGGSLEQSQRMHEHLRKLLEKPWLTPFVSGRITDRRVRMKNGASAHVLAASETAVRGVRAQRIRCDEVELFDPDVWAAAQLATRSKPCGRNFVHASIEALSTMHEPGGLMDRIVRSTSNPDAATNTAAHNDINSKWRRDGHDAHAAAHHHRTAPRLFRWSLIDVLEHCPPERPCASCPLNADCAGRAKRGVGHIAIDDAISMKSRAGQHDWSSEMLCERPRRDNLVLPEFERHTHLQEFDIALLGGPALRAGSSVPHRAEGAVVQPTGGAVVQRLGVAPRDSAESIPQPQSRATLHHTNSTPTPGFIAAGMDFGFRAPTVILWAHISDDNVIHVFDERHESGVVLASHIDALAHAPCGKPRWIAIDPAGLARSEQTGESPASLLRRAGFTIRARRLGVEHGLRLIRARLAPAMSTPPGSPGPPTPRLFIHPRCARLAESIERYRYARSGAQFGASGGDAVSILKDGADHAIDALRYLVSALDAPISLRIETYL